MRRLENAGISCEYDNATCVVQKFSGRIPASLWAIVACFAISLSTTPAHAQPILRFDEPVESSIDYANQTWQTFQVKVPRDALVLTITIEDAPVDIDLYARHGREIEDLLTDAEFAADSYDYNDVLRISRNVEPSLRFGTYYVDVAYLLDQPPMVGKERIDQIPFKITASVVRQRVDATLEPGQLHCERDHAW